MSGPLNSDIPALCHWLSLEATGNAPQNALRTRGMEIELDI